MESIKQKQVAELILRQFSTVLLEQGAYLYGKEPLVTLTHVVVSPDMGLAKIYLSVYNTDAKQEVIEMLEEHKSMLKQLLVQRIRKMVRRIPEIHFYLDETVDEMYKVENLFRKIDKGELPRL